MAVLVTIRGRLPDDPETIRNLHDEGTAATKEMVLQARDLTHRMYLNPRMTGSSWVSTSGRTPRPCRSSRPTRRSRSSSASCSRAPPRSRSRREPAGTSSELSGQAAGHTNPRQGRPPLSANGVWPIPRRHRPSTRAQHYGLVAGDAAHRRRSGHSRSLNSTWTSTTPASRCRWTACASAA
jgi:hypothetical protein